MGRHETARAPHDSKSISHRRDTDSVDASAEVEKETIEDASGENWDEAALTAIETMTHETDASIPMGAAARTALSGSALPKPDLSHADLHGADLHTADLSGTCLAKANLVEARLDQARLDNADLRGADLRSANLSEARLETANLYGAFFNQKTRLPFDKTEAIRRGMIYFELESGAD